MNTAIQSAVAKYPTLSLKVNVGKRHRIMHSSISNGSLWVTPRKQGYHLAVTPVVKDVLGDFLKHNFGPYTRMDQNRTCWDVDDIADVEKIIEQFAK